MPGSHSKKDKLKKRIAALDDVTSQHKKKSKDKEKLLTKQGKGVAPNYGNPSKVKKKRLKGKVSKLKSRLAGLAHSEKTTQFPVPKGKAVPLGKKLQGPTQPKPLWNVDKSGVPITKADRMKRYEHEGTAYQDVKGNQVTQKEFEKGGPNITDKDFGRAKGKSFGAKKVEDHEHSIQFKGYRGQYYKRASLVSTQGKFAKYWLLNAKQTNGNGWGVSQQSIAKNIHKFVGRPLVVTAKSWVPDSVYGDVYEHPYLPTNDIGQVLDHQEKYRVGSIVDIIEKDGDYFANIEINQKFAHMILPPFCSPAIFQNNPAEAEGQITDWEALHLAALHEDPAYGSRIALLRGTCVGTHDQCTIQFKSAKQEAKVICTKDLKGRLATLKKNKNLKQRLAAVPPTTKINQKDGETIANAYDKMLHNPNDSAVKESYTALIDETNAQFNELKKNGLRIDPIEEGTNPYQSAGDLHNDLKKNNHLYYYPSKQGFGSSDKKFEGNPLLNESTSTYKGKKLLNNDVFRIVHDVNGHNLANSDFSPEGEHNAFLQHRKMYSPIAGKALFTETAAQANWGIWNKKSGASNRQLMKEGRVNELVFADQKVGLLPDDIINTEWHTGETRTGKLRQRLAAWAGVETGTEANVRPSAVVKKPKGKFVFNKKNIGSDLQLKSLEKMQDEAAAKNFNVSDEEIEADLDRVQTQFITEENAKKYSKLKQRLAIVRIDARYLKEYNKLENELSSERKGFEKWSGGVEDLSTEKSGLNYYVDENEDGSLIDQSKSIPPSYVVGSEGDQSLGIEGGGRELFPISSLSKKQLIKQRKKTALPLVDDYPTKNEKGKEIPPSPNKTHKRGLASNKELTEVLKRHITQENARKYSKLRQRIAGIQRTAYASIHNAKPVLDAFKNKKPLRFGEKIKGRKREYAFQTDGKTLYQNGYAIAEHTKNGMKYSYQGHPTPTTSDTARYLGIDTFTKNGVTYINGEVIDPYGFDYVEVPSSDISATPVKVNPNSKPIITDQTKQKNKDQEAFRVKAEREALKGNQDLVVQTKTKKEVLDHGSITPKEQSNINKITGVGKDKDETFATSYDHSLPAEKGGGIGGGIINRRMSGGAVPLSRKTHFEKHFPEKTIPKSFYNRFSKLKQRIALNLNENIKHQMTNFTKRKGKNKWEQDLYGDMLNENSKEKMMLLTNLEATKDDRILKRDEDGDIINALGDTRGQHIVSRNREDKLIKSPMDDDQMKYERLKQLKEKRGFKVKNNKNSGMDSEEILESIDTGNAKSKKATNPTYIKRRLGRLIKGKQRNAVMSKNVSNIINSFKKSGVNYKGIDGIWDAVEKRVLNANEEPDRERLWDTFGRRGMGFNSVTDTRGGPNDDLKLIADQLTKIEESGGNPALGFDSSYGGSLEAVDVTYGTVPEALSKLNPQQESIGYLDEDGKFTIEYNDRYLGKN